MYKAKDIRPVQLANIVASELRPYVGRNKKYSKAQIARESNLSQNTISKLMHPDTGMKLDTAFKLFCVPELGPRLMDRLLGHLGYAAHPIWPGEGCYRKTHTQLAGAVNTLCLAFEDGRIDHTERPLVEEALKLVVMRANRLLANKVLNFPKEPE